MKKANKIQPLIAVLLRPLRSSGSHVKNNRGQAVVEYILVLVVTLGIILGVMYQFSTAFKKYVQSYFGDYVACLLETGELPTLGGTDGANAGICSSAFEPFSLKNGRPMAGLSSGDGGSGGAGRNGANSRNRSASRGGRGSDSRVTRGMLGRNGESVSTAATGAASDGDGKKRIVKRFVSAPSYNFERRRRQQEGQIRLSDKYTAALATKEQKTFKANIDASGAKGGSQLRGRKLTLDLSKFNKRTPASDASLNLSFGDYLRYLIILAIVVLIVIFFGGQLMQLKKNYDAS